MYTFAIKHKLVKTIGWLSLLCAATPALAGAKTASQPLLIDSDQAHHDLKHHKSVLTGHVTMTQGDTKLQSERAVIYFTPDQKVKTLIAYGHPAHYQTLPEKDEAMLYASADKIKYKPLEQHVWLIGHSKVTQAQNRFKSEQIFYNMKTRNIKAYAKEQQRTHIHINPSDWQ